MRRLCVTRDSRPVRGGWILFECLRECACVALAVAAVVGTMQSLMPQPPTEDAAAAVPSHPVYGLGFDQTGQQLWVTRWRTGWTLFDLTATTELDAIGFRDGRVFDADAAGSPGTMLRLTSHQEDVMLSRGEAVLASLKWPAADGLINDVRVQADGSTAVAVSCKGVIGLWTWTGSELQFERHQVSGNLSQVELSDDGRWLVMAADNEWLILFDRDQHREVSRWHVHFNNTTTLAISPNSQWIASGGKDGMVRVWDRQTQRMIWEARADILAPGALRFSPDGEQLAAGGFDKVVRMWDAATGKLARTLVAHEGPIRALAFHPGGERLYSGSLDGELFEWSLATERVLRALY
jgi:WD40 repeat protein